MTLHNVKFDQMLREKCSKKMNKMRGTAKKNNPEK